MNTCSTCAHWTESYPYPDNTGNLKECASDKLKEDCGNNNEDELVYSYTEGGCFFTGPKFGCVHHIQK